MTLHESQFDEFFGNPLPIEGFTIEEPAHVHNISEERTSPSFLPQEGCGLVPKEMSPRPEDRNGRIDAEKVTLNSR